MHEFYKHVGDYIRDTVALDMVEDGAYNRLLDQYYLRELPLPLAPALGVVSLHPLEPQDEPLVAARPEEGHPRGAGRAEHLGERLGLAGGAVEGVPPAEVGAIVAAGPIADVVSGVIRGEDQRPAEEPPRGRHRDAQGPRSGSPP